MDTLRLPFFRMKSVATGLLVMATALYATAASIGDSHPAWGYLLAFSEAAMVGAIADWFAVTALFRRPLGLPIPHTAIIPRNKSRIGANLGDFICTHFLSTEQVLEKVREFDAGQRLANWLAQPENARTVGRYAVRIAGHGVAALRDERARQFVQSSAVARLEQIDLAGMSGQLLDVLTADNRHQALLDEILGQVDLLLQSKEAQERISAGISAELEVLRFSVFGQEIALDTLAGNWSTEKLVRRVSEVIGEVNRDPKHPLRTEFGHHLERFIHNLKEDPQFRLKGEALRLQLIEHPALAGYLSGLWDDLIDWVQDDLSSPHSTIGKRIAEAASRLGESLLAGDGMRDWINEQVLAATPPLIERYREDIGRYIAGRVASWNTAELVQQLETNIGKDLQFIRINGTLVGGLVGVLIHAVTHLAVLLK